VALYRLNVIPLYAGCSKSATPHASFALSMARWLRKVAEKLEDKGNCCFEAGNSQGLAEDFQKYAENDGSPDGLARLWNELGDWGESSITTITGREKSLCEVPHLPDQLSC
jgi:hypothetical protein